jgi:hypothetical protein
MDIEHPRSPKVTHLGPYTPLLNQTVADRHFGEQ